MALSKMSNFLAVAVLVFTVNAAKLPEIPVNRALASTVQITTLPRSAIPSIPQDLRLVAFSGPNTFDPAIDYPVFIIDGVQFWALSHRDNRVAMSIAVFDRSGSLLQVIEKQGARYIYMIEQNTSGDIVLTGQASNQVTLTCAEIAQIEIDVADPVSRSTVPQTPAGLKLTALSDPNQLNSAPLFPTVLIKSDSGEEHRCWPFSFIDNRVSMSINCFDESDNLVSTYVANGARYIYAIRKDLGTDVYKFIGQSSDTVTATKSQLGL